METTEAQQLPDEFPAQQQQPPGSTSLMQPRPDHGEQSYRGSGRLTGRRALITGGDSGIGRAVVIAFAREGAAVAFTHLPEESEDAQETMRLLEAEKGRCVALAADLTRRPDCDWVVAEAVETLGGLDILVNNAGYQMARDNELEQLSDDRLDRVFKTNLYALFWLTRAALPHLGPGSSVINNSSIQAYEPSPPIFLASESDASYVSGTVLGVTGGRAVFYGGTPCHAAEAARTASRIQRCTSPSGMRALPRRRPPGSRTRPHLRAARR